VARLAGLRLGWWDRAELESGLAAERTATFVPRIDEVERSRMRTNWSREVARSRGLAPNNDVTERAPA
jgi:glycerol kinase